MRMDLTLQYVCACAATLALFLMANTSTADEVIDAARIYQKSCSVCHGDEGSGAIWGRASLATAPRDFTSEAARRELTRERMIASITYGRPGTPMPGFGTQLGMDEIAAVTDHILKTFMRIDRGPDAGASPGDPRAESMPNDLVGNFDQGRVYYMENCVACHGATGDGDGPRAYFIFPKPRNFRDPATRKYLNRSALYDGIRNGVIGKEMPAWGKVMTDQQITDIAEFVYLQFIDVPAKNH